jgi:cytochrome c oxidase assembly protein subunit 15
MFGRLIPGGLFQQVQPAMLNLVDAPLTVAFIHRWLAFVVMLAIVALFWTICKLARQTNLHKAVQLLLTLVLVQIALGILVITSHVQIAIALLHQANAVALFVTLMYLLHRLRATDQMSASDFAGSHD